MEISHLSSILFKKNSLSLAALFFFLNLAVFSQSSGVIKLDVDATETPRSILHVRETIPVKPGTLKLFYPKWIPGEHTPTGTLNEMVNFFIRAGGKPLAWRRDDVEMFAFECEIPPGVEEAEVSFDDAVPPGTLMTAALGRIKWNRVLVYPRGAASDDIRIAASLKLPADWEFGTALEVENETGPTVNFKETSLTRLVDSPTLIGRYFKKIQLSSGPIAHEVDIAADSEEALEIPPETLEGWKNLVREANTLFGAPHYQSYHFLLTLSDTGADEGLEHHESSEDGASENTLSNPTALLDLSDLFSHEYAHSWNGKHRRPARLLTPDFERPMHGDLLWVYEGLTQYLGFVLPARSRLWTPEIFRETVAMTAADMDNRSGRKWRPLVDTARAVQFTYDGPSTWNSARRGADYYDEGMLIWMEADTIIREKSKEKLSLDDFCRKFYGGANDGPVVKPYDLDEIVNTLNAIQPYDWRGFFQQRIYSVNPRAPLGGITSGGWRLIYNDTPNVRTAGNEQMWSYIDLSYSLGCLMNNEGNIYEVNLDMSAGKAGLASGMKVVKINGEDFSYEAISRAIIAAEKKSSLINLIVEYHGVSRKYNLNYHGGLRYPHLVRDTVKTDILSGIIKSH